MKNYPVLFLEHFISHERRNRGTTNNGEGRNATTFFWGEKTTGFWVCNNNQFGFCLKTNLKKNNNRPQVHRSSLSNQNHTPIQSPQKKHTHKNPIRTTWKGSMASHSHVLGNILTPLLFAKPKTWEWRDLRHRLSLTTNVDRPKKWTAPPLLMIHWHHPWSCQLVPQDPYWMLAANCLASHH